MSLRQTRKVMDSISVNGTANVLSALVRCYNVLEFLDVLWQAQSVTGTATCKLEVRGVMKGGEKATAWVEVDADNADETLLAVGFTTWPALPLLQFRVTGNGGNPADTVVDVYLVTLDES